MNTLTIKLDDIANSLERKGLLKEAQDIDIISNTIEKLAYNEFEDMVDDFSKDIKKVLPVYMPKDIRHGYQKMSLLETLGKNNDKNPNIEKSKKIIGSKIKDLISSAYSSETGEKYPIGNQEAFKTGLNLTIDFLKDTHEFKSDELSALKNFALSL
jgi:hypothetical protein